ncbi:MAG: chorismate synthase [Thermodesulfobacteriota bacterium]
MGGDCFGRLFTLTTFGESHGSGLGGIVQGCPAGLGVSEEAIQEELDKRRPGQGGASTMRKEKDRINILSGVFEGRTTGTAIGFYIQNEDKKSQDYSKIKDIYRPGHGDFTYQAKYGLRDYRGGGRSSGRETVSRVAGGAIAGILLRSMGIEAAAFTLEMGGIAAKEIEVNGIAERPYFAACDAVVSAWDERIREVKKQGDSIGGVVEVRVSGVPAGLGEPVMDKLDARLAYALMGIGAVKGVEIGSGFASARSLGSQNNDEIAAEGFSSNNAGGILAGISSGQEIVVRAAVKPIPSISREQTTIDAQGGVRKINIVGRHDICAIPRIVPVIKAMVLLTLADMSLLHDSRKNFRSCDEGNGFSSASFS